MKGDLNDATSLKLMLEARFSLKKSAETLDSVACI